MKIANKDLERSTACFFVRLDMSNNSLKYHVIEKLKTSWTRFSYASTAFLDIVHCGFKKVNNFCNFA